MNYSELSLAERDTGLFFDEENLSLIGEMNTFGVTISDRDDEYILQIFADAPFRSEQVIKNEIGALSESMPKNTINRQSCEIDRYEIYLRKSALLQENLALLVAFSETLTEKLRSLGLAGKEPKLPEKPVPAKLKQEKKSERRIKLGFDLSSVKGLLGALLGGIAMVFITYACVTLNTEQSAFSTVTEIGGYVLSAAAATLVFFDYRFLAKKLDAFGVIVCPLISVISSVFAALLATAKSFAYLTGTSVLTALANLDKLYEISPKLASAGGGYLTIGIVISVFASLLNCLWYFSRHPEEMTKSEKSDENPVRKK